MTLFSIVIPAHNSEKFIDKTLDSITAQSFDDYEVLIIDDGSTDETGQIIDRWMRLNKRISAIHQPNSGPLLARRRALIEARGDYALFLDSDDCFHPNALERIAKAVEQTKADIVSFRFSRDPNFASADDNARLSAGMYRGNAYQRVLEHVCGGRFNSLCGKAIRLCHIDSYADYGAYEGLMHGEDLFQLLPIIDRSSSLFRLDDILYYYRPNEESSTASFKKRQIDDLTLVHQRLRAYAEKWGGNCPSIAASAEVQGWLYLLIILKNSGLPTSDYRFTINLIRDKMVEERMFERASGVPLRFDQCARLWALERGNYDVYEVVYGLVSTAKDIAAAVRGIRGVTGLV